MGDMADMLDDQLFNEAAGLESHRNRGPLWTTKDGTKILVTKMETSHIQNCIAMLKRAIVDPYDVVGPDFLGGYTASVIEDRNEALEHNIGIFERELAKRRLTIDN